MSVPYVGTCRWLLSGTAGFYAGYRVLLTLHSMNGVFGSKYTNEAQLATGKLSFKRQRGTKRNKKQRRQLT